MGEDDINDVTELLHENLQERTAKRRRFLERIKPSPNND
jgi:hypothetical protein